MLVPVLLRLTGNDCNVIYEKEAEFSEAREADNVVASRSMFSNQPK